MYGPDGYENVPHREWFKMYDEVINEVKQEMKEQHREGEFFGSRVNISSISLPSFVDD